MPTFIFSIIYIPHAILFLPGQARRSSRNRRNDQVRQRKTIIGLPRHVMYISPLPRSIGGFLTPSQYRFIWGIIHTRIRLRRRGAEGGGAKQMWEQRQGERGRIDPFHRFSYVCRLFNFLLHPVSHPSCFVCGATSLRSVRRKRYIFTAGITDTAVARSGV